MNIKPIGYIYTDFKEKFGLPRQGGRVPELMGKVVFIKEYQNPDALIGLEEFSHIWLIFDFSEAHQEKWSPTVRPPRLGGNKRVGVFASRSPFRPNSIGMTSAKLLEIRKTETEGDVLIVSGIDILDKTPIYDIKPYIPYTDCHIEAKGGYAELLKDYRLSVETEKEILDIIPRDKQKALLMCLAEDPRPSYIKDDNRIYKMKYMNFDVHFKVKDETVYLIKIVAE